VIGLLIVFRLVWRLNAHAAAAAPSRCRPGSAARARVNHVLLYACMLIMPIAGYTASNFQQVSGSSSSTPCRSLRGASTTAASTLFSTALHIGTSYVFVSLIALHVLAAARHLIFPRHGILRRMLPS